MDRLVVTLKALADETRLRLLRVLHHGAFNVNELVGILELGQSRVSRHLRILLDAGLLEARRQGSWTYYELSERWREAEDAASVGPEYLPRLRAELRSTETEGDRLAVERCLERRREGAERFFRGMARRWDAQRDCVQGPPLYLDRLMALVVGEGEILDGAVVDLGTGTGVLLPRLSRAAKEVIGIDASSEMLAIAGQNVEKEGLPNVSLRLGALEHLPLPDGGAISMVANMVLHHVADPPEALREIHRGLREGGRLVVAELTAHSEESYREKLGDLWLGFERQALERWLKETGFRLELFEEELSDPGRPGVMLLVATAVAASKNSEDRHNSSAPASTLN